MDSFIRLNELFAHPEGSVLSEISQGTPDNPQSWRNPEGQNIAPVQLDPTRDFFTRNLVPSTDLVALYAGKDRNNNY